VVLIQQDAGDEAFRALQQASTLLPEDPEVLSSYAELLRTRGRLAEAEENFKKALKLAPELCITLNNYGNLLRQQGRYAEAEECFRKALQQKEDAAIHNNMGAALLDDGRIVESEACFRRALKISPGYATARLNLGVSLRKQGRLVEAVKEQRRAVKLEPQNTEHFSNLLFTLNYSSNTADYFLEEARQFGQVVAKKVKAPFSSWQCEAQAERLRVGFVSGDLYNHPVGFFLESLLGHFDSARIELIAYPTNPKEDDLTSRIKPLFAAWRPLFGLSDEAAAKKIRDEGVHVLFDLAGHTSHNRLAMMVWKPAPVQASWLGYFATTGVEAIDYFMADEVGVPELHQKNFSESIWYLPETRLCFSAPHQKISVSPLPALKNGYVTFGCFQQYTKVGDDVLTLWSAILAELPESRLRWQCKQLGDPQVVEQLHARLKKLSINPSRVETVGQVPREGYLAAHGEVDLVLDSFPYPGGTTTCEALWMGVPTVTLAGESLLSRQGASLLTAAGLPDWITASPEEYVVKAVALAGDLEGLAELRARLREQVLASPLFDAKRFARNFEDAIRGMWEQKRPGKDCLAQPDLDEETASPAQDDKPIMNFFNPVHWGTKDPALFNDLMRKASEQTTAFHYGDNMFVFQRNNSMLNDQPFMQSWKENAITPPDQTIIWRRYILAMAAFHCQHLDGDFVECGAYQGVGAKTVIDYLGGRDFPKTFWLYDVFEHNEKMVNHSMQAHGPQLYQQVVKRFKDYPNVKILKGFLPDVLAEGAPEKIAYLHLDLNQAPAEIATLDALFERVVPGGMIILDDYEMVFYRAQKLAEDEWFGKRGYKVFPLPTSQGFVIKR
jgi:predicted O-linked N-acetylglucosamine transferase (SPINDLY family)